MVSVVVEGYASEVFWWFELMEVARKLLLKRLVMCFEMEGMVGGGALSFMVV